VEERKQKLEEDLKKYEAKLSQLTKDWSETKGGSRYGDEYGLVQIKVYQDMIESIKKELVKMR